MYVILKHDFILSLSAYYEIIQIINTLNQNWSIFKMSFAIQNDAKVFEMGVEIQNYYIVLCSFIMLLYCSCMIRSL